MTTRSTSARRAVGILLAIASAALAQVRFAGLQKSFINRPSDQGIIEAVGLMIVAMVLFAWAVPKPQPREEADLSSDSNLVNGWAYGLAIVVYILSLALYLAIGENGLVRILWVAGMVLIVIASAGETSIMNLDWRDGRDWMLVTCITAVGFLLRFWRLPDLPSQFHGDIASQGLQAISILEGGTTSWFSVGWSNIPMFDFVMMAGTMRLFGQDLFGLSMTAVWQGVLTIPVMYLLGRELFGRRVGLLASALMAISYTHNHFSRIVTTASPLLFIVLIFYFLFRGLRLKQALWFVLAGLSLGMGLLVYYPTRVAVVIVAFLFFWMFVWKRSAIVDNLNRWFSFGLASLLGFGPMMGLVFKDFGAFAGRGTQVTIWNPAVMDHLTAKYGASSNVAVWLEQFKRTFLTFFLYPDASTHFQFKGPFVAALVGMFLMLGVGYSLRWLRDERYFTLFVWLVASLVLGGVITNDPPFWPHIVIVLPAVLLLAADAVERARLGLVLTLPQTYRRRSNLVISGIVVFALIFVGIRNWQAYNASVGDNADTGVRVARYISSLPTDHEVRLVRDPLSWNLREIAFLGHHLKGQDIYAERLASTKLAAPVQPTVFILTPNHTDLLETLQSQFPAGTLTDHVTASGWPAFVSYLVQPPNARATDSVIEPTQSLTARQRLVSILAVILLLLSLLAGAFLLLNRTTQQAILDKLPISSIRAFLTSTDSPDKNVEDTPFWMTRPALLRSLIGMAIALVLAYVAQSFYDGNVGGLLMRWFGGGGSFSLGNRLFAGSLLYVIAMVLFAWSAPALPDYRSISLREVLKPRRYPGMQPPDAAVIRAKTLEETQTPAKLTGIQRFYAHRVQIVLLLLGLIFSFVGLLRFSHQGEDALVRWLWLAGLLIFLAGQVIWPAVRGVVGSRAEWSPPFRWQHIFILAVILLAGFWLRFNHLDAIPNDLHGDMASMGLQAREWVANQHPNLFREGWANIPMVGFLPAAFSLKWLGNDLFALNFSAVVAGMLTLLGLYLLAWRLFDSHRLAALSSAILAINTVHIHFSRLAAYMDPWPFIVFAFFFIVDGMRARRPQSLALAGVLLALSFQMYYSGRVVLFILAAALIYLWVVRRKWLTDNLGGYGLLLLGILITLGPSLLYFAGHWEALAERSRAVFLFYEPVMTHLFHKYGVNSPARVILEQIKLSLLMFNHSIDSSTQFGFGRPLFSSALSPLIVLGVGYSLTRWRTPGLGLNLIWLSMILVFGGVLTNNAPFWPRLVGLLPAAALLAALVLHRIWSVLREFPQPEYSPVADAVIGFGLAILLLSTGLSNWDIYYKTVEDNARPPTRIGRYLLTLPENVAVCSFANPFQLEVREIRFLSPTRTLVDLPEDAPDGLIQICPDEPLVWILSPNHIHRLAVIQRQWPGGELEEHYDMNGALIFTSYLVLTHSQAPADGEAAFTSPLVTSDVVPDNFAAYMPDGSPFNPDYVFMGNTASTPWEIYVGSVDITDESLTLHVGPLPDHDSVYDYVKLIDQNGATYLFEAEDPALTSGDQFSEEMAIDDHWWLQHYEPFSAGQGLLIQKQEIAPVLTTVVNVPNGRYQLYIGSFTGDPSNGIFGLGVSLD